MLIHLSFVLLIFLLFLLFKYANLSDCYKYKYYINISLLLCILLSGLRDYSVGADTMAYYESFQRVSNTSWSDIFLNFKKVYIEGIGKDPGYDLFVKFFQVFSSNYRAYLFFIAVLFFYFLRDLFYRFTTDLVEIFLGLVIYQILFFSFFSITGLRQTIATIFTFISVRYIQKRMFLPFLLLILAASFIHKSVLLFLPLYFIGVIKKQKLLLGAALLSFPILLVFARSFAYLLAFLSQSDEYMAYAESTYETSGARNFAFFLLFTSLWCFYLLYKRVSLNTLLTNCCSLAVIFTPLTWVDPSLMRVVQYFSIFSIFLFVRMITSYNLKARHIYIFTFTLLFLFVIIKRGDYYVFFWQK